MEGVLWVILRLDLREPLIVLPEDVTDAFVTQTVVRVLKIPRQCVRLECGRRGIQAHNALSGQIDICSFLLLGAEVLDLLGRPPAYLAFHAQSLPDFVKRALVQAYPAVQRGILPPHRIVNVVPFAAVPKRSRRRWHRHNLVVRN